jgi:hypothetical protein
MSLFEEEKKSGLSTILVCLVALIILVIVGYGTYVTLTQETIDKVTLCPSGGPKGQYVVLIDNTSPFPFSQKAALAQRLKSMVLNDVPQGALVTLFLLGENYQQNDAPMFEKCNPGQWGEKNHITNTQKFVDKDFNEKFAKPLDEVVRKIPLNVRAKTSPIFEMLQIAGINGFKRSNVQGQKSLIIYSDMAANMPRFSMYKVQSSYKDFAKTAYGQESIAPSLAGASVTINMLTAEPTAMPYNKRAEFWAQYFSENGASLDHVDPMEGL